MKVVSKMKSLILMSLGALAAATAFADQLPQVKVAELVPADGTYVGTMHMVASNRDYPAVMIVTHLNAGHENYVLAASLTFPGISDLNPMDPNQLEAYRNAQANNPDLFEGLGFAPSVTVTSGGYDARTSSVSLPYTVPNYTGGAYGNLSGTFSGDTLTGDWNTTVFGTIGHYVLTRKN